MLGEVAIRDIVWHTTHIGLVVAVNVAGTPTEPNSPGGTRGYDSVVLAVRRTGDVQARVARKGYDDSIRSPTVRIDVENSESGINRPLR